MNNAQQPLGIKDINIRDPFVIYTGEKYYMYGTRAKNFGNCTGGFDVYISDDLVSWSLPIHCFDSEKFGMNAGVNWAPEVHQYNGAYYMFATFTFGADNIKTMGTAILKADTPEGPFYPYSDGPITPKEWQCLDGTLYVDPEGNPFMVFCHAHTQIHDGTICYVPLNQQLSAPMGEATTMFAASQCPWVDPIMFNGGKDRNFVTDGPFMFRTKKGNLLMVWSSFINNRYAQLAVGFEKDCLDSAITHLKPIASDDGGHGMIFMGKDKLYITFHTPNISGHEHPVFFALTDNGDSVSIED